MLRAIIPVTGIVPTSEPKYRSFLGDFSKRFNCLRESLIAYGQSRPHWDYWLSAAADDKGDAHEEASTFSAQVLTKCPFVFEKNAHGLIVSANPICTTESMLARFEEVKTGLAEVDCPDLGDLESRMKIQVVKATNCGKNATNIHQRQGEARAQCDPQLEKVAERSRAKAPRKTLFASAQTQEKLLEVVGTQPIVRKKFPGNLVELSGTR